MKANQLSLSLSLALLVAATVPGVAADWSHRAGGLKDTIHTAIPVPAPVPIPEYAARYYFRVDAGFGFGDAPDATEQGLVYGLDSQSGPFGVSSSWLNNDFETFVTLGVGTGVYFGNGFRMDVTAESRSQAKVKIDGNYRYFSRPDENGEFEDVRGDVRDETTLRGGIFMVNGYYDIPRPVASPLVPYIGAGIGLAWTELKRNHFTTELAQACDVVNGCRGDIFERDYVEVQDKTHDVSFAAMATLGATYRFNEWALLDMNYRFLYIDGVSHGFGIFGNRQQLAGDSGITIEASHEHQIRAGLRFEVN